MNSINKYLLPVPKNSLERIDRTSSPAHVGKLRNAIDLIVPINTPVLAAADGVVTYVKDDSSIGGPDPSYWTYTNFIAIMHANGEYTRYDHLEFRSSRVRFGRHVKAGQEISRVGMTGYTYIPHLHFQAFVFTGTNVWTDFETLEIKDFVIP
ncbi:MAG: M23 family metallopeptidase [Thermoproteota archaeon]|nr:M23 family metallopeptidase [Thermoproteota archaeon]